MNELVRSGTLYRAIEKLPEGVVGEIVDGQLHVHPRPTARHGVVATRLTTAISAAYDIGDPGGWWVIAEPEIHFRRNEEVLVPDIGAWRRERLLHLPEDQRFEVVPDWVCEALSPSTASLDRRTKMPVYARYGVAYIWIADPDQKILSTYRRSNSDWALSARFSKDQPIRAEPFADITIPPPWV